MTPNLQKPVNSFIQFYFYLFYAQYFILFNLTLKSMNVCILTFLFTSDIFFSTWHLIDTYLKNFLSHKIRLFDYNLFFSNQYYYSSFYRCNYNFLILTCEKYNLLFSFSIKSSSSINLHLLKLSNLNIYIILKHIWFVSKIISSLSTAQLISNLLPLITIHIIIYLSLLQYEYLNISNFLVLPQNQINLQ